MARRHAAAPPRDAEVKMMPFAPSPSVLLLKLPRRSAPYMLRGTMEPQHLSSLYVQSLILLLGVLSSS